MRDPDMSAMSGKRNNIASAAVLMSASLLIALFLFIGAAVAVETDHYETYKSVPLASKDRFNLVPSYFIFGPPYAKFQIGWIYRFSSAVPLYLGYGQLVIWNLKGYQSPMIDINCMPQFYYKFTLDYGIVRSVDLGIWDHNSNLRGGELAHRGWDRSYIKVNTFASFWRFGLATSFKFFTLYRLDRYNRGIDDYLGIWEMNGSLAFYYDLGIFETIELSFRIFAGGKYSCLLTRGGQEIGLTFKFKGNPAHIYLQFYQGYCEYLLDFNRRQLAIRYGALFYL